MILPQVSQACWIILPAYNEAQRIAACLTDVCTVYENVVVVDDASSDQTVAIARQFPVWLLRHAINRGQGAALQTGLAFAITQGAVCLVTFDADGQHRVEDIAALSQPILNGTYDIVLGTRFLGQRPGIPKTREWMLRAAVLFTQCHTGLRLTDTHNGLRAFSRHVAMSMALRQDRMAHASEILKKIHLYGWRYTEVPVTVLYSTGSLAKGQSAWGACRILFDLMMRRWLG